MWNGEGYDFLAAPDYYLVEVSAQIHGLSGDTLGCGFPFRGFLYGMTERNAPSASALWAFWDAANISATEIVGWWEDDPLVTLHAPCGGGGGGGGGGSGGPAPPRAVPPGIPPRAATTRRGPLAAHPTVTTAASRPARI